MERIQAAIFVPRESAQIPGLRRFRSAHYLEIAVARKLGTKRLRDVLQTMCHDPVPD